MEKTIVRVREDYGLKPDQLARFKRLRSDLESIGLDIYPHHEKQKQEKADDRKAEKNEAARLLYFGESAVTEDGKPAVPFRHYYPHPYPEAAPTDLKMYAGTGVGALYDIQDSERHLYTTAGWTLLGGGRELLLSEEEEPE